MKTYTLAFILLATLSSVTCFSQTTEQQAEIYFQKALFIVNSESFDSILHYVKKANELLGKQKAWEQLGEGVNEIGRCLKRIDSLPQAAQLFHLYLPKVEEQLTEKHPITAKMYAYLGDTYRKQGTFSKSEEWLEKAVNSFGALEVENIFLAHILRYQSENYARFGNNPKGLEFLEKALQIYQGKGHIEGEIRTLIDIGVYHNNLWEMDNDTSAQLQSISIYEKVLKIIDQQQSKSHPTLLNLKAMTLTNLADAQDDSDSFQEAHQSLLEALKLFEQIGNELYVGFVYEATANLYEGNKQFPEALKTYQTALKQLQKIYATEHHRDIARIYCRIANIYRQQKLFTKSLNHYQKALSALFPIFHETNPIIQPKNDLFYNEPWIMEALVGKAETFHQLYQEESQSITDLEQALQCSELAFEMVKILHQNYDRDAPKHSLSEFIHESYEIAIAVSLKLHEITQKSIYLDKAFIFMEQSKASVLREIINDLEAKQFAVIPSELLQQEKDLKIDLAYFEKQLYDAQLKEDESSITAIYDSLFFYRTELNQLVQKLEKNHPQYFQLKYDNSTVSLKNIQEQIALEQAVIEYFVGDTSIYCFVIEKTHIAKHTLAIPVDFQTMVAKFRKAIRADEGRSKSLKEIFVKTAHQLYLHLLKQPLEGLKNKEITTLSIVPDGILGYIPFDVLLYESITYEDLHLTQPYVLQKYNIGYAYASSLVFKETTKKTTAYSFGGFSPIYGKKEWAKLNQLNSISNDTAFFAYNKRGKSLHENDLKFAREDVTYLADFLGGDKWLAQAASEKNFKANAANYGILHLAMHGVVDDKNPLYSHLIFTLTADTLSEDNLLTTAEIYNLQLKAGLAVLSACDTGTGELKRGEGIMSLARAFAYAGCPSMVMSLWSVPDQETGELMKYFYQELKTGISKDKALRQAKLHYLDVHSADREDSHPYHWAAFVSIGDMQAMEIGGGIDWWIMVITVLIFILVIRISKTFKKNQGCTKFLK